MEDTAIKRTNC